MVGGGRDCSDATGLVVNGFVAFRGLDDGFRFETGMGPGRARKKTKQKTPLPIWITDPGLHPGHGRSFSGITHPASRRGALRATIEPFSSPAKGSLQFYAKPAQKQHILVSPMDPGAFCVFHEENRFGMGHLPGGVFGHTETGCPRWPKGEVAVKVGGVRATAAAITPNVLGPVLRALAAGTGAGGPEKQNGEQRQGGGWGPTGEFGENEPPPHSVKEKRAPGGWGGAIARGGTIKAFLRHRWGAIVSCLLGGGRA